MPVMSKFTSCHRSLIFSLPPPLLNFLILIFIYLAAPGVSWGIWDPGLPALGAQRPSPWTTGGFPALSNLNSLIFMDFRN